MKYFNFPFTTFITASRLLLEFSSGYMVVKNMEGFCDLPALLLWFIFCELMWLNFCLNASREIE